jgi:hypothetical protein
MADFDFLAYLNAESSGEELPKKKSPKKKSQPKIIKTPKIRKEESKPEIESKKPKPDIGFLKTIILTKYSPGLERGVTKILYCRRCGREVEVAKDVESARCHMCLTIACPYVPTEPVQKKPLQTDYKILLERKRKRAAAQEEEKKRLAEEYKKKKKLKKSKNGRRKKK